MTYTWRTLLGSTTTQMPPLWQKHFFLALCHTSLPTEDVELSELQTQYFWLLNWLRTTSYLTMPQQFLIFGEILHTDPATIPQIISIADRHYCTWTGLTGWLDLGNGQLLDKLTSPPVETIGYNLPELFRRQTINYTTHGMTTHGELSNSNSKRAG